MLNAAHERCMEGLLIRIGADQTEGGGRWNAPVDANSRRFVYVPIPETKPNRVGQETPYSMISPALRAFGCPLPERLSHLRMHLDPDYRFLTYGDRGRKGQQIAKMLAEGDLLVFYSGLKDINADTLIYAIVGFFVIERIERAQEFTGDRARQNAHSRRMLSNDADDIIVSGKRGVSGRLVTCVPIGGYRSKAYRVYESLLAAWGGISASGGYLQRSAVFPRLLDARRFLTWWQEQEVELVADNNPSR
ncbi:MAG: hypothetical protein ACRDKX_09545 [Solirubrobacterales bacterium]